MTKTIIFRVDPELHKKFYKFCIDNEVSGQKLLEAYIRALVENENDE